MQQLLKKKWLILLSVITIISVTIIARKNIIGLTIPSREVRTPAPVDLYEKVSDETDPKREEPVANAIQSGLVWSTSSVRPADSNSALRTNEYDRTPSKTGEYAMTSSGTSNTVRTDDQDGIANPIRTTNPFRTTNPIGTTNPFRTTNPIGTTNPFRTTNPFKTNNPIRTTNPFRTSNPIRTTNPFRTNNVIRTTIPIKTIVPVKADIPHRTASPVKTSDSISENNTVSTNTAVNFPSTASQHSIEMDNHGTSRLNLSRNANSAKTRGFVLSHSYWEDLTSSNRNLANLQCWAGRFNMSLVEPLLEDTHLTFPFVEMKTSLRWSDVYDIDHWNALMHQKSYALLSSWETFLEEAPRSLITVNIQYFKPKKSAAMKSASQHAKDCSTRNSLTDATNLLHKYNFRVVRQVCIDFTPNRDLSADEFYEEIFGGLAPAETTVLFSEWRGFGESTRVRVSDPDCAAITAFLGIIPSKKMIREAESYAKKYLRTEEYVAVMVRLQKAKKVTSNVAHCFQTLLQMWNRTVKYSRESATFLSADIGRFGSESFMRSITRDLSSAFSSFFNALYSHQWSIQDWEGTFERISAHPGYVGMLQKVIASRAKCILIMGGGSFQYHAIRLHKMTHPSNHCIYTVKECINN